jgi:hypothetical protein
MFHYFKITYFTCEGFTKFTYNEYIGPYFLSHVVLRFLPSDLPEFVSHKPSDNLTYVGFYINGVCWVATLIEFDDCARGCAGHFFV